MGSLNRGFWSGLMRHPRSCWENLRGWIISVSAHGISFEPFELTMNAELTFVCVQLEKRLQGVGRALVQLCIDKAKAEGIPLAVTAEPQSTVFFERLGFKEEKHVDIDLSEYAPSNSGFGVFRLTGMLWSPEN